MIKEEDPKKTATAFEWIEQPFPFKSTALNFHLTGNVTPNDCHKM